MFDIKKNTEMKSRIFFQLGLVLLLAVMTASLQATTVLPANFVQLVENSESGFQGTVTSITELDTPTGKAEQITVSVTESVAGIPSGQSTYTWTQFKGSASVRMPGMPEYKEGQEYVIFLSGKAGGSIFQAPIALEQGAFRVVRDTNGKAFATNAANNSTLLLNVDTMKMTEAITNQKTAGRKLSDDQKAQVKEKTSRQVESLGSRAVAVENLIDLAREIKKLDQPSKSLATDSKSKPSEPIKPVKLFPGDS